MDSSCEVEISIRDKVHVKASICISDIEAFTRDIFDTAIVNEPARKSFWLDDRGSGEELGHEENSITALLHQLSNSQ
jgi:hypothetical protein